MPDKLPTKKIIIVVDPGHGETELVRIVRGEADPLKYDVQGYNTGKSALEALSRNAKPALIVISEQIYTEDMAAAELVREMKKGKNQDVPIVYIGNDMEQWAPVHELGVKHRAPEGDTIMITAAVAQELRLLEDASRPKGGEGGRGGRRKGR
jgi:CheY-like chemotaxis protein